MKKALALSAFALAMAFPLVSSAASVTNSFAGSSTGNLAINVSDTIQFEVTLLADAGVDYNTIVFSTTGDAAGALGSSAGLGWAGVANMVTSFEWHYTPAGGSKVKMGTNGRIAPSPPALPTPDRVSGGYGFGGIGGKTGDGAPSMVGTVTIHADTVGVFQGGGFQYPGVDGFLGSGGGGAVPFGGGEFTVVPEPGTALLMFLGLGGLGVMGRKSRK